MPTTIETDSVVPYRVLLLETNEDSTVGGSHQCLYNLISGLDDASFAPRVLFYQDNPYVNRLRPYAAVDVWEEIRRDERRRLSTGPKVTRTPQLVRAIYRRSRYLAENGIDLVHFNNSPLTGLDDWLPAAQIVGVPCVASERGHFRAPSGAVRKFLLGRFNRILAMSEHVREQVLNAGIPNSKVGCVYGSIDVEEFKEKIRKSRERTRAEIGISEEDVLVLMVGHIREWKGQHVLLEALSRLRPTTRESVRVALAGAVAETEKGYRERLERLIQREGLEDCVQFLGFREDVPDLLSAADIAVHASVEPEPFGLVILEAMAAGTPIIASNRGGPSEILTDDTGLTFDPEMPGQLAQHLEELAVDASRRARLARSARDRVAQFDRSRMVAEVESVWRKVIKGPDTRQ